MRLFFFYLSYDLSMKSSTEQAYNDWLAAYRLTLSPEDLQNPCCVTCVHNQYCEDVTAAHPCWDCEQKGCLTHYQKLRSESDHV
jgi:hypothetical protein